MRKINKLGKRAAALMLAVGLTLSTAAPVLAADADVWLNVGMANTLDELKAACPKFADIRCVRNGFVYNNNARINAAGGNDYWESAVVNPDIVLRDLIKIFHPELVEEPFVYYKQLF